MSEKGKEYALKAYGGHPEDLHMRDNGEIDFDAGYAKALEDSFEHAAYICWDGTNVWTENHSISMPKLKGIIDQLKGASHG